MLSHRPTVLTKESCSPHHAAVVAVPMRKLCPEYFSESIPAARKANRTSLTRKRLIPVVPEEGSVICSPKNHVIEHCGHWAKICVHPSQKYLYTLMKWVCIRRLDGYFQELWVHYAVQTHIPKREMDRWVIFQV